MLCYVISMTHRSANLLTYVEISGFRRGIPERHHRIFTHTVSSYDYYNVYVCTIITFHDSEHHKCIVTNLPFRYERRNKRR
jgi:hypothetical protein